ncbi:MAG: HlyD family efflux transporter periplasmic adaptor subunit [Acidobacteriota bacterium]
MRQDGLSMDRRVEAARWTVTRILLILAVLFAAGAGVYFYPSLSRWASSDRSIDLSRLRTGRVSRGDLLRDVSVQGRVVAAAHPTLVSPAQGVVTLLVKAGDVVRRGQVMARVESPELENSLLQERSTLLSRQSELERLVIANRQADLQNQQEIALLEVKLRAARRAMERAKELFDAGLGSAIDYQKSLDDLQVAEMELEHSRHKLELTRETGAFEVKTRELEIRRQQLVIEELERRVDRLGVVSPVDGLVSRVEVRDKDTVQPSQALFSVVDLSEFEVEVLIPENYAAEIAPGTVAAVLHEGREYEGRIKSLSPEVENSQVKGRVEFPERSPQGLKQNQRVSARLILDLRPNVLKVPRGPFLESLGGRQIYIVRDGVARLSPIQVGAVSVTEIEVVSGLEEGDEVVLSDLTRFEGADSILLRN